MRDGRPGDSIDIVALLRAAFAPHYLVSSVYSNAAGAGWLRRLLLEPPAARRTPRVRVAETPAGRVWGVTIASPVDSRLHLDYIAVSRQVGRRGIGDLLMSDLLAEARGRVSLDVFASNRSVLDWYRRLGFSVIRAAPFQVADLTSIAPTRQGAALADLRALGEQSEGHLAAWGFAPLNVGLFGEPVDLILLGASVVRVRHCPTVAIPELAALIRGALPERHLLVLPLGTTNESLPEAFRDDVIRMERD